MKICIYGAGAGGGHIAVKLARSGHEVSAVARGSQLAAIRRDGLKLISGNTELSARIAASDDPGELGPQDIVLVTVKATALADVARDIGPLVAPGTRVIFVQNGMQWWYPLGQRGRDFPDIPVFGLAETFLTHMTPRQVLGGVLYTANEVKEPGIILNTSPTHNRIYFAPVTEDGDEPDSLRALFDEAGIVAPPVADVRERVWKKLLFNMNSSALALVTGNMSSITRRDPELAGTFRRMVAEALALARAYGHALEDEMNAEDMLKVLLDHKPSILQDYERRRPMEIGEIIMAPLHMARAAKVDMPAFQAVAAIASRLAMDAGLYGPAPNGSSAIRDH